MTTLPPSASDAFARLHEGVQRWVWNQGWQELRPFQVEAIHALLDTHRDLIITAATAGGKTEAAFFPILSRLAEPGQGEGFRVLYIAPLKALINDQFRRLENLCQETGIPVTRWHGDVAATAKQQARKSPRGLLLITPESLEALFVRRGQEMPRLFAPLEYVVIDELHAFIGTERGMHLQSLLSRLEAVIQHRVPRVGLSATLGEPELAAACLRQGEKEEVLLVVAQGDGKELKMQVRGVLASAGGDDKKPERFHTALGEIANHLFTTLRGSHNLVFAGSRNRVELLTDALAARATQARVPNEFFPHHGNLAKDLREEVEHRLRDGELPTTAVCTTTLELGIDIGQVRSVAQIGPPSSIAAMRQRLGRSGRRGDPAVMRLYISENPVDGHSNILDTLRPAMVRTVAAVRLLVQGWCEPPRTGALHLSTLVHQILAVIAQKGGISPIQAHTLLCGAGPFRSVDSRLFAQVLRALAKGRLIEQAPDALLMLGEVGESLVDHYSFYAVFQTPEEFRVMAHGRLLGQLPVDTPLVVGDFLIFAGKRWVITDVNPQEKVVEVKPAPAGKAPLFFGGEGAPLHDRLVAEMRQVYLDGAIPAFLDTTAKGLLAEGLASWKRLGLAHCAMLSQGNQTLLFPWVGSQRCLTLQLALLAEGICCQLDTPFLEVAMAEQDLRPVLARLASAPPPDPFRLAAKVPAKQREKFHQYLDDDLLARDWVASSLDTSSLPGLAGDLVRLHP